MLSFCKRVDVQIMMRWRWMHARTHARTQCADMLPTEWEDCGSLCTALTSVGQSWHTHNANAKWTREHVNRLTRQLKSHFVYAIEILLNRWTRDAKAVVMNLSVRHVCGCVRSSDWKSWDIIMICVHTHVLLVVEAKNCRFVWTISAQIICPLFRCRCSHGPDTCVTLSGNEWWSFSVVATHPPHVRLYMAHTTHTEIWRHAMACNYTCLLCFIKCSSVQAETKSLWNPYAAIVSRLWCGHIRSQTSNKLYNLYNYLRVSNFHETHMLTKKYNSNVC